MKNKINNYDFLVVGAGLIGSLTALKLIKSGYSVLIVDKNINPTLDNRTLAVNANSKDFLIKLGLWDKLNSEPQSISKIIIRDYINEGELIFKNDKEDMGNVIINSEILSLTRLELLKSNSLIESTDFDLSSIKPQNISIINKKKFFFKNIILCLGKKFDDNSLIKKIKFPNDHLSYVGFFKHSHNHKQTAYEIFTSSGPLAVLPSPSKTKKKSTFIFSTKNKLSKNEIYKLIKKHFSQTHGFIEIKDKILQYEVLPHISYDKNSNFFLVGDILRSIHPVAGQGWNLGIKDIQKLNSILDLNGLNDPKLREKYLTQRSLENFSYLTFTSLINLLYESKNPISRLIVKSGFEFLNRSTFIRDIFIKQAMGRLNLV